MVDKALKKPVTAANWAKPEAFKETPCRNIIIHGYCKFESEGCPFNHGSQVEKEAVSMSSTKAAIEAPSFRSMTPANLKFNAKTSSSFTPGKSGSIHETDFNVGSGFQPEAGPILDDKTVNNLGFGSSGFSSQSSAFVPSFNPYASESFTPSTSAGPSSSHDADTTIHAQNAASVQSKSDMNPFNGNVGLPANNIMGPGLPLQGMTPSQPGPLPLPRMPQFPTVYPPTHSVLQYHLYAPEPPPHFKLPLKPNERTAETLFINNDLRERLLKNNQTSLQIFPSTSLPDIVGDYFGLVPMDFHNRTPDENTYKGHKNSLYKVFSNLDGKVYFMRRIHDVKITDSLQISQPFQAWNKVSSSNVIHLKDVFITSSFNDSSLVVIYDYYPQSYSLYEIYGLNSGGATMTKEYLWSFMAQLTNAIQDVHTQGLALNNIDWKKVIITGDPGRIKIADAAIYDVLNYSTENRNLLSEQQNDYLALGKLLHTLLLCIPGINQTDDLKELDIDDDFKKCLSYLLDTENTNKNVKNFTNLFSHKILSLIGSLQSTCEYTEQQLSSELENARLFRLMCKMNSIYGRMEARIDINWAESGEKFPIVLFYDYVFHQKDENGNNIMDLTHVLRCLNKLDAGISEKIMLVTPDEMNCMIISYKELRDLIDSTFRALIQ